MDMTSTECMDHPEVRLARRKAISRGNRAGKSFAAISVDRANAERCAISKLMAEGV
jgi:2-keto-3-deoxy-L-rhamnonate aldolase RhmA